LTTSHYSDFLRQTWRLEKGLVDTELFFLGYCVYKD
jgi:hypothetical protein